MISSCDPLLPNPSPPAGIESVPPAFNASAHPPDAFLALEERVGLAGHPLPPTHPLSTPPATGLIRYTAALPTSLAELAEAILAAHEHANLAAETACAHAYRAGALLIMAKTRVPHGQWLAWIKTCCPGLAIRTVQAYMQLAREGAVLDANTQRIAHLPLRQTLKLLATPRENPKPAPTDHPAPTAASDAVHRLDPAGPAHDHAMPIALLRDPPNAGIEVDEIVVEIEDEANEAIDWTDEAADEDEEELSELDRLRADLADAYADLNRLTRHQETLLDQVEEQRFRAIEEHRRAEQLVIELQIARGERLIPPGADITAFAMPKGSPVGGGKAKPLSPALRVKRNRPPPEPLPMAADSALSAHATLLLETLRGPGAGQTRTQIETLLAGRLLPRDVTQAWCELRQADAAFQAADGTWRAR